MLNCLISENDITKEKLKKMTQLKVIKNSCRTVKTTILGNGGTGVKKY